jgi:hypothetical protein
MPHSERGDVLPIAKHESFTNVCPSSLKFRIQLVIVKDSLI